jgi:plasmid stabilization system protein ParE
MGKALIVAPSARHDLRNIVTEIAHDAPERAIKFGDALLDRAEQAGQFPLSGRIVPELASDNIRELIHPPIRIIYRVQPDHIEIVRFWHAARGAPELSP